MPFGKKRTSSQKEIQSQTSSQPSKQTEDFIDDENIINVEDDSQPKENQENPSQQVNRKPLLDEVTMLDAIKGKNAGGTKRWKCNHCHKSYSSSYRRINHHFLGPPVGVKAEIARCPTMLSNRALLQQVRKKVEEAESTGISSSLTKSSVYNRIPGTSSNPIEKSFGIMERHEVDVAIVRFLCVNGIPFNVLRSPEMAVMIKDYKHPSFDRARTSLLDDCKRQVEKECSPVSDTWGTQGASIVSDGWINIQKRPLINVIASNSRGSMSLYAKDFSSVEKSGKEIADFLLHSIEEIGPSNVLQVITDNAANCKAAEKEIEKVHNNIFWSPCVVHSLNLIFKDLDFDANFPWMKEIYLRGKNIVKYFINHSHAHAMFRINSILDLLKVTKTRFGYHYMLLKRLTQCREALVTTVVVRAWNF